MNILLIIGLPGSGKSHFCKKLPSDVFYVLDDLQILDGLPEANEQRILVIASPNFCYPGVLRGAKRYLRGRYSGCSIQCIYFENDPDKCLSNVKHRNDGRQVEQGIKLMSKYYRIPKTITPLTIWQKEPQ